MMVNMKEVRKKGAASYLSANFSGMSKDEILCFAMAALDVGGMCATNSVEYSEELNDQIEMLIDE